MANGAQLVQPGDLITSHSFNALQLKIQELENRIATLEGGSAGSGVVITGFDPPNQVEVGQELKIFGSGFLFPPQNNTVTVDGADVTDFRLGSTSSELRFLVPQPSIAVPAGGRNVTLLVANSNGTVQRSYRLLPEVLVPGEPPDVISVLREDLSPNLRIGQVAVVSGTDFATIPNDNRIHFLADDGAGGTNQYPPQGTNLIINSASETEIRLIVPEITEVPSSGSIQVTFELAVGAHPPATLPVNVRRP